VSPRLAGSDVEGRSERNPETTRNRRYRAALTVRSPQLKNL